ncbi:L-ribulose-5-phosphate 4-epimerase AraD [Botrimarina sp.]|uniref:L-ribulose-5-phosphate 4-epimerase AraD n=1 Tax=Botrimarina sp. TaxID=2795802 RepID=UPI0032ECAF53
MLEPLKEQVCQANLDLVSAGLVTLTWGNASGLSDDRRLMVIKPSGVPYDRMRPSHMVVVDIQSGRVAEGDLKPSSDTATHRLLYQRFEAVGGVTHTHSPKATAFAQARRALPAFGTTHADHFYGPVPVTRPLTAAEIDQAYEHNTGEVILEAFTGADPMAVPAVLVAGHAPFAWGADAAESVKNAIALEACAAMALDSLLLQPDLGPVEPYLLDKHYRRKHGPDAYYGQS